MAKIVYFFFLLLLCSRGGGYIEVYYLVIRGMLIYSILYDKHVTHRIYYYKSVAACFLLLCSILFPSYFILWGAVALCVSFVNWRITIVPISFWLLELFGHYCSTYIEIFIWCFVLYGLTLLSKRVTKAIITLCPFIIVFFECMNLPCNKQQVSIESAQYNVYGQGKTFSRIAKCGYTSINNVDCNPTTPIIRNNSYSPCTNKNIDGILIYDIDIAQEDSFATTSRLQQNTPWHSQSYIGNQYYLESICKDGGLYSNIGVILKKTDSRQNILSRPTGLTDSYSLITKDGGTLYLNDSDYTSSYLANYQKNFIRELVGNDIRPNIIRLYNVMCLCALIVILYFCCIHKKKVYYVSVIFAFIPTLYIYIYEQQESGEIRMVGKIFNSHESSGFDGVPKMINANGYDYCVGHKNAIVLIVKTGESAECKNEKTIVAESGATITVDGKIFTIDETPLGIVDNIVDARNIIYEGKILGTQVNVNGKTIIGTNSPAKLEWKNILK